MTHPSLRECIVEIGELPTLPGTVIRLLDLLQDQDMDAEKVRRVIERDPAMTANVLKLGNSAFYGSRQGIGNVRQALVMLGNRSVAALAFYAGMAPVLRRDLTSFGITRDQFWDHALLSAAASSLAAEHLGAGCWRLEAFTAGLIHDVGMLVVDQILVAERRSFPAGAPVLGWFSGERETLGFDHCEAGVLLAREWGFPATLVDPTGHHHRPEAADDHPALVRAVAAGSVLAHAVVGQPGGLPAPEQSAYLTGLGLAAGSFPSLIEALTTGLETTLVAATRNTPQNVPAGG